jgi:RNA polymerase sigma-70 factor (ECF subfamily)
MDLNAASRSLDLDRAVREHFARIHRAALILTGNPWDADDLAQETFLVYANTRSKFRAQSSVYTWLYGILLNLERRERRRAGTHRRKLQDLQTAPRTNGTEPPADAALEAAEWRSSLWAYVALLPDGQRQALVLRFSEGLRYEEIATVLGCPVGTVKSRIFHGLISLRRLVPASQPAPPSPPNSQDRGSHVPPERDRLT